MNFLAHIYLSGKNEQVLVGNFIGDFVKGNQFENFETDIKRGILLHRHIDEFTDHHPAVLKSKKMLWDKYRHYAGVIVDMFYDHFLAANWINYHSVPLEQFSKYVYATIGRYEQILPKGVKYMLPFMIENDWLLNYSKKNGIQRALSGMAKRTTFQSKMEEAVEDLTLHYDNFQIDFEAFFPDVEAYAKNWLEQN